MDGTPLTDLCDRLAVRLDDHRLTRYQLIDLATMLVCVQRGLQHADGAGGGGAMDDLDTRLRWIRNHAQESPLAELRAHVGGAIDAAARALEGEAVHLHPENASISSQERAHA